MTRSTAAKACYAWLCALCFALIGEEAATTPGARATVYLITDYIPPAIYEGDGLSACFRIENTAPVKSSFEVTAKTSDSAGVELKSVVEKVSVAPGAFGSVKFEFETKRVARIHFELKSAGESTVIAGENVALLRDDDAWPATKISNGRIVLAEGGDAAIPVVQKKRAVEERAFAPVKWLFGSSADDGVARTGKSIAFAPGAWQLNVESVRALGPWPVNGSIPILNALNQILGELRGAAAGEFRRIAILLPVEDLDFATDPRTYRVALDALLARLAKGGFTRIALIAPFKYGCNDAHRRALWREIHESAAVNSIKVLDPLDWMGEAQWRADPSAPKVFGQQPNPAARKMIEQALADLIR